ncbi:MAG TPA: hypothetical protein VFB99_07230 [Vicinamibacterales bacterium]|nr:hypothetical protein [Vicinamibacterales bacterium]
MAQDKASLATRTFGTSLGRGPRSTRGTDAAAQAVVDDYRDPLADKAVGTPFGRIACRRDRVAKWLRLRSGAAGPSNTKISCEGRHRECPDLVSCILLLAGHPRLELEGAVVPSGCVSLEEGRPR